eukprot:gnl/TRDRNA2_/TRDRNA2_92059_c0_seq2.p1 gnl/TRDRNA2_/TRDRNA2_92059_c0~~gnl/TRDRNA2_/TRDRNA2_92059_c0_seq2.p1  ORF type:complete len:329 (+),score=47.88 gnl/TRDRNA2_/TRDRNA2_92059_c0_seq2:74-988(+)
MAQDVHRDIVRLEPILAYSLDPLPSAVAALVQDWIRDARQESNVVDPDFASTSSEHQENGHENLRYLFGTLEGPSIATMQVFVHRKRLNERKQRFLFLHFYSIESASNNRLKDRKEIAMVYFEAASGTFHGLHIAPEHRGRGLMKLIFLYYVLFCHHFALPALDTAHNKKPSFAKLYTDMGYKPICLDFPFLFYLSKSEAGADQQTPVSHVFHLPAENPRKQEELGQVFDKSWRFSPKFIRSQGLVVVEDICDHLNEGTGLVKLYAKTAWMLPDAEAISKRQSILNELSCKARCTVFKEAPPNI